MQVWIELPGSRARFATSTVLGRYAAMVDSAAMPAPHIYAGICRNWARWYMKYYINDGADPFRSGKAVLITRGQLLWRSIIGFAYDNHRKYLCYGYRLKITHVKS